jgi:hypothetical protein
VTEPQDEKLQQRPVGRIRIDDQDGRHGPSFALGRGPVG